MKKDELIGIFRTSINNCKLVYASIILLSHEDIASFYAQLSASLNIPRPFKNDEIIAMLNDKSKLKIAVGELYDTVHRAAFKELFEITKCYCKETEQLPKLQDQEWYQFWRIIRNCFSHTLMFAFNDYDKKRLPVKWKTITIDESMEGKCLTHGNISRGDFITFLNEVADFIKNNLT